VVEHKAPTYQIVKGFISTTAKQGSDKPFTDVLKTFTASCFDTAVKPKRQEHAWLAEACYFCVEDTEIIENGKSNQYRDSQLYTSLVRHF